MSPSLIDSSALSMYDVISKSSGQMKADGYAQLSLGKRHLLVSDIPEAVSALALACELLAKQFGETDAECAEAYFYYGKALLEMSRLESGVLGNVLEGMPEGGYVEADSQFEDPEKMTPDEKSEVEAKVKEALDFNYQTCEVELKKAEEECEGMETGGEEIEGNLQEDSSDEAMEEESSETVVEKASEGDEEPSNLEHTWEMPFYGCIVVIKKSGADGSTLPLVSEECLIGRAEGCDIRMQLPIVSKEHAKVSVTVDDGKAWLTALSETNPTQLNGEAVENGVRNSLHHNDLFTIGGRHFRWETPEGSRPPPQEESEAARWQDYIQDSCEEEGRSCL